MTGFGEAERDLPEGRLRLEIKTVNHRFLNVSVRMPTGAERLESELVQRLRAALTRGHVTAQLALEPGAAGTDPSLPRLDLERARAYRDAFEQARTELGMSGDLDLSLLARFGELFRDDGRSRRSVELDPVVLAELADEAIEGLLTYRASEGERLRVDLAERLVAIDGLLSEVEARAPARLVAERDRLRSAVAELTESHEVDEDRLAKEIAYLAERWDVNEELVRFRSHVEHFREALESREPEGVGKRLGFILQEMLREANTIGSKSNDADMARAAVGLKEEIERLREQIENVE